MNSYELESNPVSREDSKASLTSFSSVESLLLFFALLTFCLVFVGDVAGVLALLLKFIVVLLVVLHPDMIADKLPAPQWNDFPFWEWEKKIKKHCEEYFSMQLLQQT